MEVFKGTHQSEFHRPATFGQGTELADRKEQVDAHPANLKCQTKLIDQRMIIVKLVMDGCGWGTTDLLARNSKRAL